MRRSFSFLVATVLLIVTLSAEPPLDPVETVQKAVAAWVKTRSETVRVEDEWNSQRELMEGTVLALEQRAKSAEEKRDDLKAKTAREREELDTAEAKNKNSTQSLSDADAQLKSIQTQVIQMRGSLPPRLSAALDLPYKSLASTELSPGDRMQLAMTVINRCLQFNRVVTAGEEAVMVDGEASPKILEVIYWGLSRGYALDRAASKVWSGSPGPQGWHWEPLADAAPRVAKLIAVYNDKAEPLFVSLPASAGRSVPSASASTSH